MPQPTQTKECPDALKKAINNHCQNPQDQQTLYPIDSAFWNFISDGVCQRARNREPLEPFFDEMHDLVNLGLSPGLAENSTAVKKTIEDVQSPYPHLRILSVAEYLIDCLQAITQGNRKQLMEKDLKILERQMQRVGEDVERLQSTRRETLLGAFPPGMDGNAHRIANQMDQVDGLRRSSYETRKAGSQGVFVSVERKRGHALREKQIEGDQSQIDHGLTEMKNAGASAQVRVQNKIIMETLQKSVDMQEQISRMRKEIAAVEQEKNAISPLEIENRIRDEVEYLRDLVKLSAKRLRLQGCPLIHTGDTFFTASLLRSCLDRVLEFDPLILKNDRVNMFGKPSVLLVPGNGNALYDWKHNQIVVPIIPHQKDCVASIATGMVEYRLDVDEDKKLLNAYQQIPDHKKIRSIFQLKAKLTKEYVIWMTSEYKGFRVLPMVIKKWFDREIAPNRNEIFTPPQYQRFAMTPAEFKSLCANNEAALADVTTAPAEDLWIGSIINYQNGKFEKTIELLKLYLAKKPDAFFGYFNMGQACAKAMHRQEAVEAFGQFSRMHSQSWWSAAAHEIMRQLQMG